MSLVLASLLLVGCKPTDVALGDFVVTFDRDGGALAVDRKGQTIVTVTELAIGNGASTIEHQVGSYLFDDNETAWQPGDGLDPLRVEDDVFLVADLLSGDRPIAVLEAWTPGEDLLVLHLTPYADAGEVDRVRATMACAGGTAFLGAGGHQQDVDHGGEAFRLWVSEPGIGKVDDDDPPDDWFLTGTRHAASHPVPWVLRPEIPVGVGVQTGGAVDLDLCASDPDQWSMTAWDQELTLTITAGDDPVDVIERQVRATGGVKLPGDVAFGPWNDGIKGRDAVLAIATALREAGAPTGLMWTEDWKGAEDNAFGYHLSFDWYLDETLYPDPEGIVEALHDLGFGWQAYLSPFVGVDTVAWDETADVGLLIHDADGAPYTVPSAIIEPIGFLDLTDPDAAAWAQDRMVDLVDVGFVGWMADFAEWLPPDAVLDHADAVDDHNLQPLWWQDINAEVLDQVDDAAWFVRSGWTGTPALAPVTWGGDQRTSFDTDDGFPTVVAMGAGYGASGVAIFGHDIGGYSSVGNDPSDKELWFRWASLGAFSPIMRTHHGALADDNWSPLSDAETTAHWVRAATWHAELFPYLRGLAARAESQGTPMLLPPALAFGGDDYGRVDAWALGDALLVAPVLERGVTGREVELPPGDWYDWWTGAEAQSGWVDAALDEIPVFVPSGSLVPLLAEAPETFLADHDSLTTLGDVDGARVVRVFGGGGRFVEADGTTYAASGAPDEAGVASDTFASGELSVGGLTVAISGTVERAYTIEVWP
ncbi:MAG: hypothetical protein H6742_19510 [Alphaproteobacteria bacterium]|nr:hypothetical protein [Alphaproteobacteria bacterium]